MRALLVTPKQKNSAQLVKLPWPKPTATSLLVEMLAVGVCGTDREIIEGLYGSAPPGRKELIIGHESYGRVIEAPEGSGFHAGDSVVGIVRRPDPIPCSSCAAQEWDMCKNGLYTERGIKELDGYCSEQFLLEPEFAVSVDPTLEDLAVLLEPASIVAKAWQQTERIGKRAHFSPKTVLVTGAGPIGLLAAMMGFQRGYSVHVLDRLTSGPKPRLVRSLGATYHSDLSSLSSLRNCFDIVFECTGSPSLVIEVIAIAGPNCIVCLTGLSSGGRRIEADIGSLNRCMVLENGLVFGSVNANRKHYEIAAEALGKADKTWLAGFIARRVPLQKWREALMSSPDDVKTIITAD